MLSVHITSTGAVGEWAEATRPLLDMAEAALASNGPGRYVKASSPEAADIILFVEPEYIKLRRYIDVLLAQPLIRRFPDRCFVADCADTAWGFLPGVYTNLRAKDANRHRFRAQGYLRFPNPLTEQVYRESRDTPCDLFYSFQGARSSPVRARMFERLQHSSTTPILHVDRWLDHSTEEHRHYLDTIARSRFVLCPAGNAPSSYRLYETMQMGRVPVIISDTWTPSDGPAWPQCSLRLAESRIQDLPDVLRRYEPFHVEMGIEARRNWEQWFAPDIVFLRYLESIESILLERPAGHDERRYQDWDSWSTLWKLGWTVPQRGMARVRKLIRA